MPIRYMGTKRSIADRVQRLVSDLSPDGRVLDLFSGIGCVAESLADISPVHTNDALSFTAVLARARFKGAREFGAPEIIAKLRPAYREAAENESRRVRARLRDEQRAIDLGVEALAHYMSKAEHVANSAVVRKRAHRAASATGPEHYRLISYYFSDGYFSLRQAIQLDALRYAIDVSGFAGADLDWALAAWLGAAATLANAPGHTAQYLKPNTERAYRRIKRYWMRNIWDTFQNELVAIQLIGTEGWRERNRVQVGDALDLIRSGELSGVAAVYADPPYTKDQYRSYYHVYETMYRYDYPGSYGAGRVREDRFNSSFCLKTQVGRSFDELFSSTAALGIPLILSYPSDGLLSKTGYAVREIGAQHMRLKSVESFSANHSTLGASKGTTTKSTTENLYVYVPN
jgi:adenine-specific DNA-methyltransferase